ncbi:hypothetical protein BGZ73_001130 [Actinomortierella ambigua]|nr:hypothetical protein BGZ73_001130 [Actinomortierella ambigua]
MPLVTSNQAVDIALKQDGIVPDVLPEAKIKTMLIVSYGGKDVVLGNKLTVADTQHEPKVSFMPDSPTDKYTLMLVDPDAPNRKDHTMREWRHWVVSNISMDSSDSLMNISGGQTLTPYKGPSPPAGSGPHRYVFLLYKQTPSSDAGVLSTPLSATNRGKFKAAQFAGQAGLQLVGANYFFAENK